MLSHSVVSDSNPMGCRPPGSSVHGISQARILEWVAISFSRESSHKIFSPACKVYHDVNVLHYPCSDLPLILLSLLNYVMSLESNFLDFSTALAKFPYWKWPFLPYLDNFFLFLKKKFFLFEPFLKSLLNLFHYCFYCLCSGFSAARCVGS